MTSRSILLALTCGTGLFAQSYLDVTVKPPTAASEARETYMAGVTKKGLVAGYYRMDSTGYPHGFVRDETTAVTTLFDVPGSLGTMVVAINNAGTITGYSIEGFGLTHGFVRDKEGKITTFDPGPHTYPIGINSAGEIAGYLVDSTGHTHGFVRSPDGNITMFDPPICNAFTHPVTINDRGEISGWCFASLGVSSWIRLPATPYGPKTRSR
jgi:hypothetical protein